MEFIDLPRRCYEIVFQTKQKHLIRVRLTIRPSSLGCLVCLFIRNNMLSAIDIIVHNPVTAFEKVIVYGLILGTLIVL